MDIPDDVFAEPDVDPDTLAHLGPLRRLAGIWEGQRGHDVNPKAAGPEQKNFYERIEMLWEPATGLILQTVAIPRGQVALAAGHAEPNATKLILKAERGQTAYGICSNDFLEQAFRTDSYRIEVDFHDDGSWSYVAETNLMVKGRDAPFLHHDTNTLVKVGEADLNPRAKIVRAKKSA